MRKKIIISEVLHWLFTFECITPRRISVITVHFSTRSLPLMKPLSLGSLCLESVMNS